MNENPDSVPHPDVPADANASGSAEGSAPAEGAQKPQRPAPNPKGGRVSATEGGGTGRQNDRRRELRELFREEFYKARKNPKFRFRTAVELGAHLGVTERTIRTDIKFLQIAESLPIDEIKERGGWGLREEVKAFEGDEFSRGEFLALWMAVQSFGAWGALPQQQKMPALLRKLKATTAEIDPEQLKQLRRSVTFKAGGFLAPVEQAVFDTVLGSLLRKEELTFGYVSLTKRREAVLQQHPTSNIERPTSKVREGAPAGCQRPPAQPTGEPEVGCVAPLGSTSKEGTAPLVFDKNASVLSWAMSKGMVPKPRRVQPLHLLCWEHAWYLFAWDYKEQDIRTFALGRMSTVEGTGEPFEPAVKFDLRKELSKSFGITRGKKAVQVHLRFEKRAIPLIIERLWHPSQEMIENEDGTLDLTMEVAVTPELVRWVLSWGADCAVLAPESLDDDVLEESRKKLAEAAKRRGLKFVIGS